MNFKVWWKLNNKEKASRSFFLAPFCFLLVFLPFFDQVGENAGYFVALITCVGFIVQGLIYRAKAQKESSENS